MRIDWYSHDLSVLRGDPGNPVLWVRFIARGWPTIKVAVPFPTMSSRAFEDVLCLPWERSNSAALLLDELIEQGLGPDDVVARFRDWLAVRPRVVVGRLVRI